ncbi:MAG: tRNA lysidine(34) synthetase TilS [Fidelibacterota bacterium]
MKKTFNLKKAFSKHLNDAGFFPKGSGILLAVSGGVDSVVLLDLMSSLAQEQNWRLEVAHYNHGIRGRAADEDERFTNELAMEKGLPFHRGKLPVMPVNHKMNWEAYARHHRYEFLEKCRKAAGLDWITTAHHAMDQVETMFMRLLHGTGVNGLQGIHEQEGIIVRPLLRFRKESIDEYAQDQNLLYRHDVTNDDLHYERNFLRKNVLPLLEKRFPDYQENSRILSENIRELEEFVKALLEQKVEKLLTVRNDGVLCLNLLHFSGESTFIKKRLIHYLTDGREWRAHVWYSLETFFRSSQIGRMMTLPGGWTLLRDREDFLLTQKGLKQTTSNPLSFEADNVSLMMGNYRFELEILDKVIPFVKDEREEIIDVTAIPENSFVLRGWQPGDRMQPLGLGGSKKVSDILIDRKLDRLTKARQYVLTSGGEIVWLCGICLDDRFKVTTSTSRFGRLKWRKESA